MVRPPNDDVLRLLSATGERTPSYRSFSRQGAESGRAPLIEAVFADTSGSDERPLLRPVTAPALPKNPAVVAAPAAARHAHRKTRSIADIRQILETPGRRQSAPALPNELQGLFERLDR